MSLHRSFTLKSRRKAGLVAAASALALMASACVIGPTPEEVHSRDWEMAARTDTPQAYGGYLRLYPAGPFAAVAEHMISPGKVNVPRDDTPALRL